jgi:hypothetical protein
MSKLKYLFEDLADYRTYAVKIDDYMDEIPTLDHWFTHPLEALTTHDVTRNYPLRFEKWCENKQIEIIKREDFGIFLIRKQLPIDTRVGRLDYQGQWEVKALQNPIGIEGRRIAVVGNNEEFRLYQRENLVKATLKNITSPEQTYGLEFDDIITLDYYERLPYIRYILGEIKLRLRTREASVIEKINHLIRINE